MATTALVVPHTHWDRAWYWPFARLQIRLVECLDGVLRLLEGDPLYRFTCDGQALMVEDYLEARPQDRQRIMRQVASGRLKLGPLYCQGDLYCTGGEALIRNLQLGRAYARALGGGQRTMYMADTFGIIPSLPSILQGFGIGTVLFMRGLSGQVPTPFGMDHLAGEIPRQIPEGTRRFRWSAADGSEVRAMHLRDGYANAGDLGRAADDRGVEARFDLASAVERLRQAATRQDDAQGEPLLLLAGVDHQLPQPRLSEAMRAADDQRYRFVYSDLDALALQLEAQDASRWPAYRGEFHGSGAASVLGGTISTRIYLKIGNARAERLLVNQVEPALALARLEGLGEATESALPLAWRHLLRTHPHDDICGCSVDAVHRDGEHHLAQCEIGGDALRRRTIRRLVTRFGGVHAQEQRFAALMYSSQVVPRQGPVQLRLDLEGRRSWGDYTLPERFRVVDERRRPIPFRVVSRGASTEHPHQQAVLELHPTLPPTTLVRCFIEPARREAARKPRLQVRTRLVLENRRLRVEVSRDGSITLTDRRSGLTLPGLGAFWGQADAGDSYDFADLPGEAERPLAGPASIEDAGGQDGLQAVRIRRRLRLPAGLAGPGGVAGIGSSRRSRRRTELPVELELALAPGSSQLEVLLRLTNTACDHRLRWTFPLPWTSETTVAGLKFNRVIRPVSAQPGSSRPRIHPEHPSDHFIACAEPSGRRRGLAIFANAPLNTELVLGQGPRLALTVLRAVGFLTRPGLSTRDSGAGPLTPTPEAQCLGRTIELRFALRPFTATEEPALFHEAALWRAEPLAGQIEGWWEQGPASGFQGPFLRADQPVVVSACAPALGGPGADLRLFNAWPTGRTVRLTLGRPLEAVAADLDGRRTAEWPLRQGDGVVELSMPSCSLRTLALAPRAAAL